MPPAPITRKKKLKSPRPKAKASRSTKRNIQRIWRWGHVQIVFFLLAISFILTIFIAFTLYAFISLDIPDINSIASYKPAETTLIYNANNEIIDRVYTENRILVDLADMPPLLPKAFVAAEDSRFFQHGGVDGWSILRALVHNIRSGGRGQGGSTITQQVARSLLLTPEKTYTRKLKEAILAYRIDKTLAKEKIIHIYLNQIYLGEGSYGVATAAETYFGKSVANLNLAEIAILAGLPQAPSRYSPLKNIKLAKRRQAYVLNRMAEDGHITEIAARKAYTKSLFWATNYSNIQTSQYFLQHVKNYVNRNYSPKLLASGGLKIFTTIDPFLQNAAQTAVQMGLKNWANRQGKSLTSAPQAALVAIDNKSANVLSLVGGSDFRKSQFNRATQAKRQPGSAFKPIIYTAALVDGFTPNEMINDEETQFKGSAAGKIWVPRNFSGNFYGPTTLRNGLVYSRNIVTIKLLQEVGISSTIRLASAMGIRSPLTANLALALGSSEISLLELTSAYTVLSSGGEYRKPVFIKKIVNREGKVLEKSRNNPKVVLDENVAYQVTYLLQGVIKQGTGKKARGLRASAGKTGTTDKNMDAWFVGYNPKVTTGVWVGHDIHKSLGKRETGGRTAAPIWLSYMKKAEKKMPAGVFEAPDGITFIPINQETGEFEYIDTDNAFWEAFRKDNLRSWKDRLRR